MKAFGTFKGGGVKGLAHVGAYKAADDKGIEFIGVAGTSAGSIVAALIAVGYTPDELYDAVAANAAQAGPFGEPYTQFFDMALWNRTKSCGKALGSIGRDLLPGDGAKDTSTVSSTSAPVQTSPSKKRWFAFWKRTPKTPKTSTRNPLAAYLSTTVLVMGLLSPYLKPVYNRFRGKIYLGCFLLAVVWLVLLVCSNMWGRGLLALLLLILLCAGWKVRSAIKSYAQSHRDLTADLPQVLMPLVRERGLFPTQNFADWLDKLLKAKISKGSGENGSVLFKDIAGRMPLKVIAANVTNQSITVFSQADTPDTRIVDAVAASISIPLFFQPKSYGEKEYVDGGLVSNTPAWALDDERAKIGMGTPTLVFNLEERKLMPRASSAETSVKPPTPLNAFGRFLMQLVSTLLEGHADLQYRQVGNLLIVPLTVNVSTLDIELDDAQRYALYDTGFRQAVKRLNSLIGPRNPDEMKHVTLPVIQKLVLQSAGKPDAHLRVAVLLKICKNSNAPTAQHRNLLRVCYSFNMDNDADDQIELEMDAGAAGECWQKRELIFADMEAARKNFESEWQMTKYQQALVRPTLQGLLCVPIFAEVETEGAKTELLGILGLDTDDKDLRNIFEQAASGNTAVPLIKSFAETLTQCGIILRRDLTS